jgi:hypothetical protein
VTHPHVTKSAEISIDERKAQHAALDVTDAIDSAGNKTKAAVFAPATEPQKPSVTKPDVTETPEAYAARLSAHALREFTVACRHWLPKMTEADQQKARQIVAETAPKISDPVGIHQDDLSIPDFLQRAVS